jgi:hypothetical protein
VPQLSPEGLAVFNAATNDRPGVRYGCVVARARPPGLRSGIRAGVSAQAQARFAVFSALHQLSGRMPRRRADAIDPAQAAALQRALGRPVTWSDSDGVVPSLSQVRGELVAAVAADHLDVVGHFDDPAQQQRAWLASGSGFDREAFAALWQEVAAFVERAHGSTAVRTIARRRSISRWRRAVPAAVVGVGIVGTFAIYEGLRSASAFGGSMVAAGLAFAACVMVGVVAPLWGWRREI